MTLIELLIVYAVLALLIWLVVGLARNVRNQAKQAQALQLMGALSRAMALYETQVGQYPAGGPGLDAAPCLLALAGDPACRAVLRNDLPVHWRAMIGESRAWPDPWGTPLRYVWGDALPRAGAARDGPAIPYLESAGADRDFGGTTPRGLVRSTDNLRTDEPLPPLD